MSLKNYFFKKIKNEIYSCDNCRKLDFKKNMRILNCAPMLICNKCSKVFLGAKGFRGLDERKNKFKFKFESEYNNELNRSIDVETD